MSAFFSDEYNKLLDEVIQELEDKSSAELVVVVYQQSSAYRDIDVSIASFLAFTMLIIFFFIPTVLGNFLILSGVAVTFAFGVLISPFLAPLRRLLLNKKRKAKQAELVARAIFQKANIHRTTNHTGILLFLSLFEREAVLLWDLGVDECLPPDVQTGLEELLQPVFSHSQPAEELIKRIRMSIPLLEEFLPVQLDDVNELPNQLDIII